MNSELVLVLSSLQLIIFIVSVFAFAVLLMILSYKITVNNALKKTIKPYFKTLGYTIERTEFPGILSNGNFPPPEIQIGGPVLTSGSPYYSSYVNLFLSPGEFDKATVRITAKIDVAFFTITNVEYSKPQRLDLIKKR